jgi:crotonobetainyl-CoA:carnitine CoA-transferase CaiB-like acyl-CoA transferase
MSANPKLRASCGSRYAQLSSSDLVCSNKALLIRPGLNRLGVERHLIANPVQFDEHPPHLTRGPRFAEQTDEILREVGRSGEEILQLKIGGTVT